MTSENTVVNFDPNLNYSGNMAKKTVRLTFGVWDYRYTTEVVVGGNCSGLDNITTAVSIYLDELYDEVPEHEQPKLVLKRESDGETLLCEDDEDMGERWLADMLISAEIINIVADTKTV